MFDNSIQHSHSDLDNQNHHNPLAGGFVLNNTNKDDSAFDYQGNEMNLDEVDSLAFPTVDQKVIEDYVAKRLPATQSRLVSELILKSKEWAETYRILLKESAQG